jgi:ribonuclease P protein component
VYRQGHSASSRHFVLYAFPREEVAEVADDASAQEVRFGVSVGRRVGGAVERNKVKRLLREAFGTLAERLPDDQDVVVVARPEVRELAERDGLDGVTRELRELVDKAAAGAEGTQS